MARDISLIKAQIMDAIAADEVLSPLLTSTSKRAIFRLFAFCIAACISVFEQLIDVFKESVENTAASAAPASNAWIQKKVLEFQYSDTNPQVLQLVNFVPSYPVVDPTLRIISRCSVITTLAGNVTVKVATGEPPAALSSPQLSALQSYLNQIGVPVAYLAQSGNADLLYIDAQIYYLGQYGEAIKDLVITAIKDFLAMQAQQENFNGKIKISDLERVIKNVPGVTDVIFYNIAARDSGTAFANKTFLVQNAQTISRLWNTISGYMVEETTTGQTFSDTLQFIPE